MAWRASDRGRDICCVLPKLGTQLADTRSLTRREEASVCSELRLSAGRHAGCSHPDHLIELCVTGGTMHKFRRRHQQRGFTLIELMIVGAILGLPAPIPIPLYANVQARARLAKAQADARALASAVSIYGAHMGNIPTALSQLTTVATNSLGQTAGPFMASVPSGPTGWGSYAYFAKTAGGTFTIKKSGGGTRGRL